MNLQLRIAAYVASVPGAVSGQGGHSQTFSLACSLYNGFALSEQDTLAWLSVYNQRCVPPWSERELQHKAKEAVAAHHSSPRGHLLNGQSEHSASIPPSVRPLSPAPPSPKHTPPPVPVCPEAQSPLPEARLNPTIAFLLAAFDPTDGVSIAKCVRHATEDRDIPENAGKVYPRDQLIELLDSKEGDPNLIFESNRGAYVRINPMSDNGKSDSDVTCFRHVLVEFDQGSPSQQWQHLIQSGAPISVVLTSGGKSIHAFVRVNAKDANDYKEKRDKVYAYFVPLGADPKNKNPSRFSRLPGMMRNGKEQQLLAVNIGARSFEQWLIDQAASGIGTPMPWQDLIDFKSQDDGNSVLGNRWLCRGGSLLIVGPTGVGKSSFGFQAAVLWALGLPFLGIKPKRPLKSIFVQAENDIGDMAEIAQGVLKGCSIESNPQAIALLTQNLVIIRDQAHVGIEFAIASRKLIDKHKPDLFWADPLLSYYGADVKEQKEASTFLRTWLNPISEATGVIWVFLHHTPKPSTDTRNSSTGWQHYAYAGLGSVEFSGWARAIIVLVRNGDSEDEFRCIFAKRGYRSGATDTDGSFTTELYLAHGSDAIFWRQIPKPKKLSQSEQNDLLSQFALSLPQNTTALTATFIVQCAAKFLNRGIRTTWKLWDKGNGPLSAFFVKSTIPGLYQRKPTPPNNLPYPDP